MSRPIAMSRLSYIIAALCWLLVSTAPSHAAGPGSLTDFGVALDASVKAEACHKLTATVPAEHQCNGLPAQAAATTRTRGDAKHKPAPLGIEPTRPYASPTLVLRSPQPATSPPAYRQRRSHFWRVFPISMRLRN